MKNKLPIKPWTDLSDTQIEFLCDVFADGNSQVRSALEMLTGQTVEQHSVQVQVARFERVAQLMNFPPEAMAVVACGIRGDIGGDLLFLQTQQDLRVLSRVMSPMLTGEAQHAANKEARRPVPEWLIEQR